MVIDREHKTHQLPGTISSHALVVECFAKGKENIFIHLKLNTTAFSYINKFRGTDSPELNHLTKSLWNLVGRVLSQVRNPKAQLVLVTPHPTLLKMLVQEPLLLPNTCTLLDSFDSQSQQTRDNPNANRVGYLWN